MNVLGRYHLERKFAFSHLFTMKYFRLKNKLLRICFLKSSNDIFLVIAKLTCWWSRCLWLFEYFLISLITSSTFRFLLPRDRCSLYQRVFLQYVSVLLFRIFKYLHKYILPSNICYLVRPIYVHTGFNTCL